MAQEITYIAHRGASYLAPENTLASIKLAWELGAKAAECDIMLTKDNKVVLFHDKNGRRLTNQDFKTAKTDYAELKKHPINLKATNREQYKGETAPLLSEVLATIPEDRTLVIEIKTDKSILPHLQKVIKEHWKTGNIAFIAFDFECILAAKEAYSDIPCYYLSYQRGDLRRKFNQIINSNLDGIDLDHKIIDKRLVDKYKKHGKATWCWTVNTTRSALRMKRCGVFHLTTDRPKWLKEQVAQKTKN